MCVSSELLSCFPVKCMGKVVLEGSPVPVPVSPFSAVTLYNCSVGHSDCSRCQTADAKYNCVWCGGEQPSCLFQDSCKEKVADMCPAPLIHSVSKNTIEKKPGFVVRKSFLSDKEAVFWEEMV